MPRLVKELYKVEGKPVHCTDLTDIWAEHVKLDNSGVYELPIVHGVECDCCSSRIVKESLTHPTAAEAKREKRPGRPRMGRRA